MICFRHNIAILKLERKPKDSHSKIPAVGLLVLGPEATFSEIGTIRRDKGSYVFCVRYMYVDNEMR